MDYKEVLFDQPVEGQDYPFNSIEFFDQQKLTEKMYLDKSQMNEDANDQLEAVVDSYLGDHPDVKKAVAYREESPEKRFAFREFGRN